MVVYAVAYPGTYRDGALQQAAAISFSDLVIKYQCVTYVALLLW